jgi:dihydrofolate reductase
LQFVIKWILNDLILNDNDDFQHKHKYCIGVNCINAGPHTHTHTMMQPFKLIAAMCSDGGMGYKGQLPWPHCKADMAHFAKRTTGSGNNAVIMGKKTWDSIPVHPLRRRANLILSSQQSNGNESESERWFSSIPALFAHLESAKYDEVWIIGGASIYEQFLAMHKNNEIIIDEMCITTMDPICKCDTFFPLQLLHRIG